ncbi:MAG: hypothetical protein P8100_08435 [bacterium]
MTAITSCQKNTAEPDLVINSYPIAAGNEWVYDRQVVIDKQDSLANHKKTDPDTLHFIITVWIEKDTVLNDTMPVTIFKQRVDDDNRVSIEYNFLDNEGLKNYAYANAGGNFFPKQYGISYFMISHLPIENMALKDDEIFYETPPTLKIKFPLKNKLEWNMREPSPDSPGSFRIDKEVIGMEMLGLGGRKFECLKVQWDITYPPLTHQTDITDWIAKEGLVKRLTITDTAAVTNELGEILYYARLTETLTLKDVNIK